MARANTMAREKRIAGMRLARDLSVCAIRGVREVLGERGGRGVRGVLVTRGGRGVRAILGMTFLLLSLFMRRPSI